MLSDDIRSQLSDGEEVLIDTRQHWMAAIRFALRPIALLGLVVLLVLLNQWLDFGQDSFLSFINTIIHFVLVVLLIVAVIWLPIDLVRWYSRHYVLTNRRVIRSSGVLRKQTFGSSLEKINDIGLNQSVFGRALGYADLTFYTAADINNVAWDQLTDGLQFKKASIEAKEGLRVGVPLATLPDDFVVKGGTNEASRRADGKVKAEPVGDGAGDSDAAASGGAAAGVGAAAPGAGAAAAGADAGTAHGGAAPGAGATAEGADAGPSDGGAATDTTGSQASGGMADGSDTTAIDDTEATAVPAHASPLPEPVGPITAEPIAAPALVVDGEADSGSEAGSERDTPAEPKDSSARDQAASEPPEVAAGPAGGTTQPPETETTDKDPG